MVLESTFLLPLFGELVDVLECSKLASLLRRNGKNWTKNKINIKVCWMGPPPELQMKIIVERCLFRQTLTRRESEMPWFQDNRSKLRGGFFDFMLLTVDD